MTPIDVSGSKAMMSTTHGQSGSPSDVVTVQDVQGCPRGWDAVEGGVQQERRLSKEDRRDAMRTMERKLEWANGDLAAACAKLAKAREAMKCAAFAIDAMHPHDLVVRELVRHGLSQQLSLALETLTEALRTV